MQEMLGLCQAKNGTEIDELLQAGASEDKRAPQKKDEDAAAAAELLFVNGGRRVLERTGKNGSCKDGAEREQQ